MQYSQYFVSGIALKNKFISVVGNWVAFWERVGGGDETQKDTS